jgi:hypothetical protein
LWDSWYHQFFLPDVQNWNTGAVPAITSSVAVLAPAQFDTKPTQTMQKKKGFETDFVFILFRWFIRTRGFFICQSLQICPSQITFWR